MLGDWLVGLIRVTLAASQSVPANGRPGTRARDHVIESRSPAHPHTRVPPLRKPDFPRSLLTAARIMYTRTPCTERRSPGDPICFQT